MPQHGNNGGWSQPRQPIRLANGLGLIFPQNIARFGRQAANRGKISMWRDRRCLITAERINIHLLPPHIAGIAAISRQLGM
jgi:hypothetical protein